MICALVGFYTNSSTNGLGIKIQIYYLRASISDENQNIHWPLSAHYARKALFHIWGSLYGFEAGVLSFLHVLLDSFKTIRAERNNERMEAM